MSGSGTTGGYICDNFEYGEGAESEDSLVFFTDPFGKANRDIRRIN